MHLQSSWKTLSPINSGSLTKYKRTKVKVIIRIKVFNSWGNKNGKKGSSSKDPTLKNPIMINSMKKNSCKMVNLIRKETYLNKKLKIITFHKTSHKMDKSHPLNNKIRKTLHNLNKINSSNLTWVFPKTLMKEMIKDNLMNKTKNKKGASLTLLSKSFWKIDKSV